MSPVSIGSAALVDGTATITPKLTAGGTTITASYNQTGRFAASTSAAPQTYRTVDTSTTSVCTPSTLATTFDGATASWGMSEYSNAWSKTATGDVAVDDELFEFTGGQVTADADCARVKFDGSLTVLPYPGMSPAAFTLSDPMLTVSRSGAGNWTAQMTTDSSATPKRVTFATFSGVSGLPTAGADGVVTIVPTYAGAVAAGTWSGTYSDSWPNEFVIEVPADIRAFFYLSGTTAAQLTKPPAPVELAFTWPAAAVEPGTDEPGTDGPGTDEPVVIPPAAQPAEQEQCVARSVSGASLTWGVKQSFRSYVTGSIAHGSVELSGVAENGGDYRWTGGSGSVNVADAAGRIAFDGTVRFTGHDGQLDLTISDPRVIMTGSTGVLVADVFSKSLQGPDVDAASVALATLDLSDVSTSGSRVIGSAVPATLTENGAKAFGGFYSAGTALDSVAFTAPLGAEVACDSYSDTKLASTGVRGELLFGGAAILLLLGAALVVARRRRSSIV